MSNIKLLNDREILQCNNFIETNKKIIDTLTFARENINFYKNYFSNNTSVKNEKLTLADFPIMDKEKFKFNYNKLIFDNLHYNTFEVSTTGSTGIPAKTVWSNKEYNIATIDVWNVRKQFGANVTDSIIYFLGLPQAENGEQFKIIKKGNNFELTRIFTYEAVETYIDLINSLKGVILYGSPSTIYHFSNSLNEFGFNPPQQINCIELNGEMLTEIEYETIKNTFKLPILNNYGCREMWPIALTCPHGTMHVRNNLVWVESTVNKDLLITSLIKRAQPLINYMVGDLGEISYGECTCGLTSQIITKLVGRKNDYIFINSKRKEHWAVITKPLTNYIIENNDVINEFFIHQKTDYSVDVYLIPGKKFTEFVIHDVKNLFLERYPNLIINICLTDSIKQNQRGKRIYLQCDINDKMRCT